MDPDVGLVGCIQHFRKSFPTTLLLATFLTSALGSSLYPQESDTGTVKMTAFRKVAMSPLWPFDLSLSTDSMTHLSREGS